MNWLRNTWYCAMFSDDLAPGAVASRILLNEAIVIWRDDSGVAHALEDRCPHRYAPLSLGRAVKGGQNIQCRYHGLEFDGTGACVHNPHVKGKIPANMAPKAYPLHEYCGIVWLWMGNEECDLTLLPDLSMFMAGSPYQVGKPGWLPMDVPYELLVDNLMDLSHAALLHEGILGNEEGLHADEESAERTGDMIYAKRFMPNVNPPRYFDLIFLNNGEKIDQWLDISWQAPCHLLLDVGCTRPGTPRDAGTAVYAQHLLTPVTDGSCMYHYLSAIRNPQERVEADSAHVQEELAEIRKMVFAEQDGPMVAGQYAVMKQKGEYRPTLLPTIDKGVVLWRRTFDEMLAAESRLREVA